MQMERVLNCQHYKLKAAENYYSTCGSVDHHNWHWMGTLNFKKSKQKNRADGSTELSTAMSIFDMCVVFGLHRVKHQQPVKLYRVISILP
jgi:hypothetical protein